MTFLSYSSLLHVLPPLRSAALANLGVNSENKARIASVGGIPKLVSLASRGTMAVKIEAVAALANLAVNDQNEIEIVEW